MNSRPAVSPTRRIAIIDLGSNSARAVIMNYRDGYTYHLEDEIREIVRLREGMTSIGLSEAAMQRGLSTLHLFKQFCNSLQVDDIIATATSAVREAANGEYFLEQVRNEVGLSLRILEGDEEAYYGVLGALGAVDLRDGVVVDIGGGSAQLSRIRNRRFDQGQALTLGALALTERFVRNDPIQKSELQNICIEIERQIDEVSWLKKERGPIVGLGGTIRNLAKISAEREKFPLPDINGYCFTLTSLDQIIAQFVDLPINARRKIPGLVKDRADIILPGALVIRTVLRRLGCKKLTISESGLREGLFFEKFWNQLSYPVQPDLRRFSVLNLARFYDYQEEHAQHVQKICLSLFDQLTPLHGMGSVEREWLSAAALLHDIGTKIRYNDHHKHSQTLIINNGLPGYEPREIAMIALVARYHRKGTPQIESFGCVLAKGDDKRLLQLSSILRLAEYLERGRSGVVRNVHISIDSEEVKFELESEHFPRVEIWGAKRNASELFEIAFLKKIHFCHLDVTTFTAL